MKLTITLDNEKGNKIDRTFKLKPYGELMEVGIYSEIYQMINSMEEIEKENYNQETITEAKRLVAQDKSQS